MDHENCSSLHKELQNFLLLFNPIGALKNILAKVEYPPPSAVDTL